LAWTIERDKAWIKTGDQSYRHYCGASITKNDDLWIASTVAGLSMQGRKTALSAIEQLQKRDKSFWFFEQFGRSFGVNEYGGSSQRLRPMERIEDSDQVFVFCASAIDNFPAFVMSIIRKYFFAKASCLRCFSPMSQFQTQKISLFDGRAHEHNHYLVCDCGYPVWRMDKNLSTIAQAALDRNAIPWRRKERLRLAGGRHTPEEIREILLAQAGRCIYCNVKFTDECHPSKDHLLPLLRGGGDWSLNIVLACRSCNSRRGAMPFRTFCRLLSPLQNRRILKHLHRRVIAIKADAVSESALKCLIVGLALNEPKDERFQEIQRTRLSARRNAAQNRLLPATVSALLKQAKVL
jgi:hypothetical protein